MKFVFCCSMMYYIIVFWWLPLFDDYGLRLLLKQLVTMEVILWTSLWNTYKDEFENETNMLGGSLGAKAAEDLRQRIIEHVSLARHGFIFTLPLVDILYSLNTFDIFQNILVVSKYYSRITLKRLAELLCLSIQVCWWYNVFSSVNFCISMWVKMDGKIGFLCYFIWNYVVFDLIISSSQFHP